MKPLTVEGELNAIDQVLAYVGTAAAKAGLSEKAAYCLRLAVDEIATNIINHGYQASGSGGKLTVKAKFKADKLIIHLEDNAAAFDPRQHPPPDNLNQPLQKRKTGNLGIFLAMWGVDKFRYECVHGYNRSTFIMDRPVKRSRKKAPS